MLVGYSPWGCKEWDRTERLHSLYIGGTQENWITPQIAETLILNTIFKERQGRMLRIVKSTCGERVEKSGLASSHGYTKVATMCRKTISDNDLRTRRKKKFTTKHKKRKPHWDKQEEGDTVWLAHPLHLIHIRRNPWGQRILNLTSYFPA